MAHGYIEEEVFKAALEAVKNNVVIPIRFEEVATEPVYHNQLRIDKVLQMTTDDKLIQYCVEIKKNITKATIGLLAQQKKQLPNPLLIVANHINEFIADLLKENKIEFIDTAGNVFINQPPLFYKSLSIPDNAFPA